MAVIESVSEVASRDAPAVHPERRTIYTAVAWTLIGAHVAVRTWIVSRAWFKHDDFYYLYRLSRDPVEWETLYVKQDGHLMPGSVVLTWVLRAVSPGSWWPFVAAVGLMHLAAAVLVWHVLRTLFGWRPLTLVLLAMYLGSAITLASVVWWSAAMQFLPLQIGTAAMLLLVARAQTSTRLLDQLLPAGALAATLLFFERGLVAAVFVVAVLVATPLVPGAPAGVVQRLRATRLVIGSIAAVCSLYAVLYVLAPINHRVRPTLELDEVRRILLPVVGRSALPGLVGGPLDWFVPTPLPDTPLSMPATWFVTLVCVGAAITVLVAAARRPASFRYWLILSGLIVLDAVIMSVGRVNQLFPWVEFQPRYISAVLLPGVILVGMALGGTIAAAADRAWWTSRGTITAPLTRALGAVATAALLAIGAVSTWDAVAPHSVSPSRDYVTNAVTSARNYGMPLAVLPHPLPAEVMGLVRFEYNTTEVLFSSVDAPFVFPAAVERLFVHGRDGTVVPGRVNRNVEAVRSVGECLVRLQPGEQADIPLGVAAHVWPWYVHLDYRTTGPGFLDVTLGDGRQTVPLRADASTAIFQLLGGGDEIAVGNGGTAETCVTDLYIGSAEPTP